MAQFNVSAARSLSTVRIGCIGAGGYSRRVLLPNFKKIPGVELVVVANSSQPSTDAVAKEFGFARQRIEEGAEFLAGERAPGRHHTDVPGAGQPCGLQPRRRADHPRVRRGAGVAGAAARSRGPGGAALHPPPCCRQGGLSGRTPTLLGRTGRENKNP